MIVYCQQVIDSGGGRKMVSDNRLLTADLPSALHGYSDESLLSAINDYGRELAADNRIILQWDVDNAFATV